jgi:hypothetical protein
VLLADRFDDGRHIAVDLVRVLILVSFLDSADGFPGALAALLALLLDSIKLVLGHHNLSRATAYSRWQDNLDGHIYA